MKHKDLHVVKPLSTSEFLYLFTFTRGKLWPLNGGNPFISQVEINSYARVHKYTRIFFHSHVTCVELSTSVSGGETGETRA